MVRRLALVSFLLAAVHGAAFANGRPPGTSSITFKKGAENEIVVGLTFGLLFSHDGGRTWAWMCENAIGYTGMYDPTYAYSPTGALFATTYDGLKVVRDQCVFNPMPSGLTFTSTNTIGPNNAFYFAAAQTEDKSRQLPTDFKIYRSTDDGKTFNAGSKPGSQNDTNVWWQSLAVAPSNASRIYVSGYSYQPAMTGGEPVRKQLLFRSDNAGDTWTETGIAGISPIAANTVIDLVGIDPDDPQHLYARVKLDDNVISDSIYKSSDGGTLWSRINHKNGPITAFVVRRGKNAGNKHDLIVGTQTMGAEISHDDGVTWTALVNPPHLNCLVENSAGELWGCTQNYSDPNVPSDEAGIMKTTDLTTWTKVLRYQELTQAVTCAAGTVQHDSCAAMWCAVCDQLGCKPDASYACPQPTEAPAQPGTGKGGGCCEAGGGASGPLALALTVGTVLLRPRRRRAHP